MLPARAAAGADTMALTSLLGSNRRFPGSGRAYEERVFRYLAGVERSRSEQAGSSFVLVLVGLADPAGDAAQMPARVASAVLAALASSVRDVDVVGWYREGRIAGALLVQGAAPPRDASKVMVDRLRRAVSQRLPEPLRAGLRVWVKTPGSRKRLTA